MRHTYGYIKGDTAYYFLRDHQGSVRQVVSGADGSVVQENHYYPYGGLHGESCAQALSASNGASASPYKYGGKEHISFANAHLLDFSARTYDPTTISFHQPDPCQEKFYTLSPYLYCMGNPINLIDSDGKRPSANEAAMMAAYVYKDGDVSLTQIQETGWDISKRETSVQKNGPQSVLFERTVDGVTEFAYVYTGSKTTADWVQDFVQLVGLSSQYKSAISQARTLSSELGESELTFVGHSLGGGKAIASSMATGRAAITFNPAAVSELTKKANKLNITSNVVNYIAVGKDFSVSIRVGLFVKVKKHIRIGGDVVNNAQSNVGLALPGKKIEVKTGIKPTHTIKDFLNVQLPEP